MLEAALSLIWCWRGVSKLEGELAETSGRLVSHSHPPHAEEEAKLAVEEELAQRLPQSVDGGGLGLGLGSGLGSGLGPGSGLELGVGSAPAPLHRTAGSACRACLCRGTRRLRLRPAGSPEAFQRQSVPQVAPSSGQPRPTSHLICADRPHGLCSRYRRHPMAVRVNGTSNMEGACFRQRPLARRTLRVLDSLLEDARPVTVVVEVVTGEHAVWLHLRPVREDVLAHVGVVVRCVDEGLCEEEEKAGVAGQPEHNICQLAEAGRGLI